MCQSLCRRFTLRRLLFGVDIRRLRSRHLLGREARNDNDPPVRAGRGGACGAVRQMARSMRSMSSSEKPKWWPISWISTCFTTSARSSPLSHQ